uniref:MORF/ORRM1/DAG-like MORF domain-containing protein n=1 Tax=Opuntia streptacantha TaxID=393608 RepID=A0A7C8ZR88_OPUST
MQSYRRAFISLRRQFFSTLKSNPPISCSLSAFNQRSSYLNCPSFSCSTSAFRRDHRRLGLKYLISCNSPPLITYGSFKSAFNGVRSFATRLAESNSRPPKETIMLAGCDWEHWLVVVEAPDPKLTRDEIIDGYIKTLAHVVGSEEEARMKIYSVSTRHYYAFGVLLSEEVAYKLKGMQLHYVF